MIACRFIFMLLIPLAIFSSVALAQRSSRPSPEMSRLAQALAGDWSNSEVMERSGFFPSGGERRGSSHCQLDTGGTTLICQGESDGTAGMLNHLIVMWWDDRAKLYGSFACFKENGDAGCKVRGTAHWEGDLFVNDYTEEVEGKPTKFRDSFVEITPKSHTLIAAMQLRDGSMRTLITTKSTRR